MQYLPSTSMLNNFLDVAENSCTSNLKITFCSYCNVLVHLQPRTPNSHCRGLFVDYLCWERASCLNGSIELKTTLYPLFHVLIRNTKCIAAGTQKCFHSHERLVQKLRSYMFIVNLMLSSTLLSFQSIRGRNYSYANILKLLDPLYNDSHGNVKSVA